MQEKCDGMRFNAVIEKGSINFFGRSGKPITVLCDEFKRQFFDTFNFDCMIDGELLVKRAGKILDVRQGNLYSQQICSGVQYLRKNLGRKVYVLFVWDIVRLMTSRRGIYDKHVRTIRHPPLKRLLESGKGYL